MPGDSGKACTAGQAIFKRLRIQAFMPQQIQQRAGIEISGAGRARDSTQRSERHGGVAAAAVLDGADAAATPQMREDGAALQDSSVVAGRSEEHTSELQSLMRHSYAVFCLNNTNTQKP